MKCPSCGAEVVEGSAYCPQCGARLSGTNAGPKGNNPGFHGNAGSQSTPGSQPNAVQPVPPSKSAPAGSSANQGTQETDLVPPTEGPRFVQPPVSQPADEGEQELWRGGYSGKDMYEAWTLYALLSLILLVLCVWVQQSWLWWASVVVIVVLWVRGTLVLAYRKLSVAYRLTSRRFFHEKGILRRVTDRIELIDIDDITVEQSIIDRLVGVGTIKITSSDRTHPVLIMPGVKDVRRVADLIDEARLKERRRRAIHFEQV